MGFFDNEEDFGIEDFFKSFTGGNGFSEYTTIGPDGKRRTVRKSSRSSNSLPVKQVVAPKQVFFVFDFSGEKNVSAEVGDELIVNDYGEKVSTGEKVLKVKTFNKELGSFGLPKKIKLKTLESTFNNGILEVKFRR